jgi:hypothetical protein
MVILVHTVWGGVGQEGEGEIGVREEVNPCVPGNHLHFLPDVVFTPSLTAGLVRWEVVVL